MKLNIRSEYELFLLALAFFTRIPVPSWVDFSSGKLRHASRYYALVGLMVGAFSAGVFVCFNTFLSTPVSVLLCMCFSVYLTGAFHEDGFADCCDGFGGGCSVEQKLSIMKDSRIGTYGAVGLVLILLLKWQLLVELDIHIALALIIGHALSRMLAGSLTFALPYVRNQDSKVRAYTPQDGRRDHCVLLVSGLIVALLLLPSSLALYLLLVTLLMRVISIYYLRHVLGGYTGDCLGAVQQISEIVLYLIVLINV